MEGSIMLRVAMLVVGVGLVARPATAVVGDLNADGKVDLQDFFLLADNFGREGAPEVCEDPDTPGDEGVTRPILDAIGDSTTLALASFNIRIFSTGSRDDAELPLIADRLQRYGLIAIQEVRDTEVVDRVLAVLAERGLDYEAIVSEPVGRRTTERYAFMWRPDLWG
jgi:hypothetical protein